MKSTRWILSAILLINLMTGYSQQENKVLLTIGGENITTDEFVRIYLKNNQVADQVDKKSIEEYLDLFINYKLKVIEAKNLKLDTAQSFRNEYLGYRKQLAQPYLSDTEMEQKIIDEAYERMKYEISASHILVSIPEQATPADTLKLYQKALAIRARIKKGEPFDAVARATSDDPSVKRNGGYLGYFTVFQMVYPFESAAYRLPKDSVSNPVRTRFGYHIIKAHDKRPAQGQVKIAHIMAAVPQDATPEAKEKAKAKIQEAYKEVLNNEDFTKLAAKYSDDPGSSKNGGELPWFGTGRMIPEIEAAAFSLTHDGQVTEPIQSIVGWHIIKRLGRKTVGTYEEMLPEIKKRLSTDTRSASSKESFIRKLKAEYGFREDTLNLRPMLLLLDSTIYRGHWTNQTLPKNQTLFNFAGKAFTQNDFGRFIAANQRSYTQFPFKQIIRKSYNDWVNQTILGFEEAKLEEKYPEFKYLSQEYYDGILLFDLTDKKVWSRASNDSIGIEDFYKKNLSNYAYGERVHYWEYTCNDPKTAAKTLKLIQKRKEKGLRPEDITAKMGKGSTQLVTLKSKVNLPDDAEVADYKSWVNGISPITNSEGKSTIKELKEVTTGDPRPLSECRGQVISDYQLFLEKEWLDSLHQKYKVTVNQEVLSSLIDRIGKN